MGTSIIQGEETILFADNASFDGTERDGRLQNDGELWIGSGTTRFVRKNTLTAGTGISITNGPGTIEIAASGSSVVTLVGNSGASVSNSGTDYTVKAPAYSDQGSSTTVTPNSGSYATAAITLTTPTTASLVDGDLLEFVATNGVLVIQLSGTQVAHLGSVATSAGGTLTSSATGDSIGLRYQASTDDWWAISSPQGNWTPA